MPTVGSGIVVLGAGSQVPSHHFAGHLAGVRGQLADFVVGLIDGQTVALTALLDVIPRESNGTYARVGIVDIGLGAERAFIVAFQARTRSDLVSAPSSSDPRGTPTVLADFHNGPVWELCLR